MVTDGLYPFLVPSTTGALSLSNLYSAKQSGRRSLLWSAVFFQPQKGDYEPLRRQAGGARKQRSGAHAKLKGGLRRCCECLWEEGLETGSLNEGRKLSVSCKSWGTWGPTGGRCCHLPLNHHPAAIHLLPAVWMLQHLSKCRPSIPLGYVPVFPLPGKPSCSLTVCVCVFILQTFIEYLPL